MIIELPAEFYKGDGYNKFVRVNHGILEIQTRGQIGFEKLMIELTYAMKGKNTCCYCGKRINPGKITIDHVFPVNFGGISIPNNLEPACGKCNSQKSNLNSYEYNVWRTLETKEQRNAFFVNTVQKKRKKKYQRDLEWFDLPRKWVTHRRLDSIKKITKVDNRGSQKFKKMLSFARRNNKLPRPIVVSSNGILLDGETAYAVAKALRFETVPAIILENVRVLRN